MWCAGCSPLARPFLKPNAVFAGHILTRIVCKGSYALGVLKEYTKELEVLEALLSQKRWRRARRGRWHERRALILMTHMGQSEEVYLRAMEAVRCALEDDDTHTGKLYKATTASVLTGY